MKNYKSALGKSVDMGAIIAKNEKVRAVGNMKVNARGDTIDSWGKVIKPVTSKVNQAYAGTVGNRSGQVVKKTDAKPVQKIEADNVLPEIIKDPIIEEPVVEELTAVEMDMEAEFEDDELTEQIKAEELRQQQLREAKKGKK